jgi:hypothetical protein
VNITSRLNWKIDNPMVNFISTFYLLVYIGLTALAIYVLIIIIKLAKKGVKALDIYIAKNQDKL